jgi:hypothetical protein
MPTQNEIGARAGRTDPPARVIFVRMRAGRRAPAAKPVKGGPKKTRKPSLRGRTRKQEKTKMIKLAFAIAVSLACYVALGIFVPALGHVAIVFPLLVGIPTVGVWLGTLTFKGILSLATFGTLSKKLG